MRSRWPTAIAEPVRNIRPRGAVFDSSGRSSSTHLWRLSGLQAVEQGDRGPDTESPAYRQAQAKFAWLRASPQFADLVAELSRRPGATVVAKRAEVEPRVVSSASPIGSR
jgi:hypothetical protein